jgi:hypothetical protein
VPGNFPTVFLVRTKTKREILKASLSAPEPTQDPVTVRMIRSGEVIERFEGQLPMEIDFEDAYCKPGEKIYYRVDLHGYGKLVSNPIFVTSTSQ